MTDRASASLAVGRLPDGRVTAPSELCDAAALQGAIDAYGYIEVGEVATFVLLDGWRRVHVVGLEGPASNQLRVAAGRLAGAASGQLTDTLHLVVGPPAEAETVGEAVVEGYYLGQRDSDPIRPDVTSEFGEVIAESVNWARELVNRPPNLKDPATVVSEVISAAPDGVVVEVLGTKQLRERSCNGVLAVGAGSANSPCMLDLQFRPPGFLSTLTLVGKGVVFDSGGLSLKRPKEMYRMKDDISGGAAVLAATFGIARLRLPIAVRTLVPLVENMVGPASMRPGDVLTMANGTTVEVVSTDAEGRLVLADSLFLADQEPADLVVDVASLTHAAEVALGPHHAAVFCDPPEAADDLLLAADSAGESMWPLPVDRRLIGQLESSVADLKNSDPGAAGGAIIAAVFLERFVSSRPWIHIDLGGTIWSERPYGYPPAGATGFGVSTLIRLARLLAGRPISAQAPGGRIR